MAATLRAERRRQGAGGVNRRGLGGVLTGEAGDCKTLSLHGEHLGSLLQKELEAGITVKYYLQHLNS